MEKVTNKSVIANFMWRLAERCGSQIFSFVVSLVLARLLSPDAYGTIALITVIINILQVFVDSGMANALIQKKNADNIDFSTVFYFNVATCIFLYIGMFFAAPWIARFYKDLTLIPLVRVLSFTIVIAGVKNVQQAYVSRNMQFKRFFYSTLVGTIVSAVVGITMAYCGYGVWALVGQQLINQIMGTVILWITVRWRPEKVFSLERLKTLFSYGWKLLASSLINTLYEDLRQLIIGQMYSTESLAYYNRGNQFPTLVINNINSSINSVLMPVMSKEQDDLVRVKKMMCRTMQVSVYVIAPLMLGLVACGTPLIRFLLTEKWMECVPFMTIFCITYMFYPLHTANLNAMKALGRSDIFLKLEIYKKIVGIVLLLLTMRHGVMAMAYSLLVSSFLSQLINTWPNKKLLKYGYMEQLKDILPSILLAIGMGACIFPIQYLGLPDVISLILMVGLGAVIYIGLSATLKLEPFVYLWTMAKPIVKRMVKR